MHKWLCVTLLFLVGCCPLKSPDFVEVVQDHRVICVETCDSLIKSIDDELNAGTSADKAEALIDLRERLVYISNSSVVIDEYVKAEIVDAELLAEILRNKWKAGRGE